ncbi:LAQU0S01e06062g1_1 [Lachancea quebecensis]|uniref:LAQU0S01e06062g1_1 n=1 Tax=Lachancea quebecensis TaxID=1654605 RepID=A0A0N7MKU0_9SACH|nr:LAQU0S01e06062g1_1 [Lachancea quebecensis]
MSFSGVLHNYAPRKVAFEFNSTSYKKVVIFIGGLGDGLLTVPYVPKLAEELGQLGWSVIQIQFTSSFKGWGLTSLDQDASEIKELVDYLKSTKGGSRERIVLFGHSTGSQDTMHYLLKHSDTIDAGVLQASVSDREYFSQSVDKETWARLNATAKELVESGKKDEILPLEYAKVMSETPVTAYRWCSLALPGGDDDYFSSDIPDETLKTTFGRIKKPFLVAYSEQDQIVPAYVDKKKLLERWQACSGAKFWSKNSGLVNGANHQIEQAKSQDQLLSMVRGFLIEFEL